MLYCRIERGRGRKSNASVEGSGKGERGKGKGERRKGKGEMRKGKGERKGIGWKGDGNDRIGWEGNGWID